MPPPRPRGVYNTAGVSSTRPSQNTPMSERQQMALLIQMTASTPQETPRTHVKKNDHKKNEDTEEASSSHHDRQEDRSDSARDKATDDGGNENRKDSSAQDITGATDATTSSGPNKRNFSDVDEEEYEDTTDDTKKKRRKETDTKDKESKTGSNTRTPASRAEKGMKQLSAANKGSPASNKNVAQNVEKETVEPKPSNFSNKTANPENDGEDDEFKMADSMYNEGLKVPPLKIVIPPQSCAHDTDGTVSRTGKVNTSRNAALPYVVSSNNNEAACENAGQQCGNSPHESPIKVANVVDEKSTKLTTEEKNLHRVLRSSHRSGGGGSSGSGSGSGGGSTVASVSGSGSSGSSGNTASGIERSSNNSSPQMQSSSPSPASSSTAGANENAEPKISFPNTTSSPMQTAPNFEHENITNLPSPSTSSTSSSKEVHSSNVELHPRKRKIRSKNDDGHGKSSASSSSNTNSNANSNNNDPSANVSDTHPHDFPFTNCFQMYLNIRRQIEKKWRNVYHPVKPRPPQGYSEYLLNKKTYLLAKYRNTESINIPQTMSPKMRDIYLIQQKERGQLSQRHTVEREKLCLNVEQEIIRVHSKAARMQCQSVPISICTLLKDEEVYNIITPEQEEKDRNSRHRFTGRLLLSWLQDVDDKWEKIKESMVLRHHNEAESLHAVQLMDWEIALKKFELCDFKSQLEIDPDHVPCVHVSDDFDLLPA